MTKMELSLPLCVVKGEYLAVNGAAASAWARRICYGKSKDDFTLSFSVCDICRDLCVFTVRRPLRK